MKVQYTVADPAKNITLLVTSPAEPSLRHQLGARLLPLEKDARQAAFLERGAEGYRLETACGEFDGGAVMAAASLLAFDEKAGFGETLTVRLQVAGVPGSVTCEVTPVRTCDLVTLAMPLPLAITDTSFPLTDGSITYPVVSFPGISHVIVPAGTVDRASAQEVLGHWSALLPSPAAAMLFWNGVDRSFDTLLYRKAAESAEWLNASADGAAAIAAWLTTRQREGLSLSLKQPGGVTAAVSRWQDGLVSLTVSGTVSLVKDASVDLVF
jgi:hypothetical protein